MEVPQYFRMQGEGASTAITIASTRARASYTTGFKPKVIETAGTELLEVSTLLTKS